MSLMRKTGFLALATTWLAALIPAMAQNNGQSPANAIWIRDADSAARQPVQFTQTVNTSYYWDAETVYTVPAGKLLVIEYIAAHGQLTSAGSGVIPSGRVEISGFGGGAGGAPITLTYIGRFTNGTPHLQRYAGSSDVKLYVKAGQSLLVSAHKSADVTGNLSSGHINLYFTIHGYLVDTQ